MARHICGISISTGIDSVCCRRYDLLDLSVVQVDQWLPGCNSMFDHRSISGPLSYRGPLHIESWSWTRNAQSPEELTPTGHWEPPHQAYHGLHTLPSGTQVVVDCNFHPLAECPSDQIPIYSYKTMSTDDDWSHVTTLCSWKGQIDPNLTVFQSFPWSEGTTNQLQRCPQ